MFSLIFLCVIFGVLAIISGALLFGGFLAYMDPNVANVNKPTVAYFTPVAFVFVPCLLVLMSFGYCEAPTHITKAKVVLVDGIATFAFDNEVKETHSYSRISFQDGDVINVKHTQADEVYYDGFLVVPQSVIISIEKAE